MAEKTNELTIEQKVENLTKAINHLSATLGKLDSFVAQMDTFHSERFARLQGLVQNQRQMIGSVDQSQSKIGKQLEAHIRSVTAEEIDEALNGKEIKKPARKPAAKKH